VSEHLQPGHVGRLEIQDDDVRLRLLRGHDRHPAVTHLDHRRPELFELELQNLLFLSAVVHDQDANRALRQRCQLSW
jgi:hypothetical protein